MLKDNTRKINEMIARNLAICSIVVVSLLLCDYIDIFNFEKTLVLVIGGVGFFVTLSPIVLYICNVPDDFLKYYMLILLALLIGIMGTFNGIGIYITFVLVPIVSCLYFERKLTVMTIIFSYIVMCVSVYINTAGKMEVKYYGWSHMTTFEAYIIGFTLEYFTVSLFIGQIIKISTALIKQQHEALLLSKAQEYRYELLSNGTEDVIFEYFYDSHKYKANRSIYAKDSHDRTPVEIENLDTYDKVSAQVKQFMQNVRDNYENNINNSIELDLSYEQDGELIPLWYLCEGFVVYDDSKAVSIIGKLHDITQVKMTQRKLKEQRVSDHYMESLGGKSSIYELMMQEIDNLSEDDFKKLMDNQQFLAGILNTLKYAKDLKKTLIDVMRRIGEKFGIDRIAVIESDLDTGSNVLNYQWSKMPKDRLENFFQYMTKEEIENIVASYDFYGYLEINPGKGILVMSGKNDRIVNQYILPSLLGTQLWIPTLTDGNYTGAIFFDKYDTTPYTMVEKFVLSEMVNAIMAYINKINAENLNKAKTRFISTMSHEIRTPMNVIIGMTEVALREEMSPEVRKCLKTVQSSAFGLLELINDILDWSKVESGKIDIVPEKYYVLSMVNDVYEMVKVRNNNKLVLKMHVDEDMPAVLFGDMLRIKQVMINFCTNSIKYTDKGNVDIYISSEKIDDERCMLRFSVKDTGIGIRTEDMGKIFQSFEQVDPEINHHKEGTGLGLSICKQLVDLMEGNVEVESEYGKRSTFSFNVPQRVLDWSKAGKLEEFNYEDVVEDKNKEEEAVVFTAPDARILIVDDTELNLMVAEALLEPLGMHIDLAVDGYDALEKVKENVYDIIFMDHFMPEMDGVETTKQIRQMKDNANCDVPIVALTADAMSGVKEEMLSRGMNDFLAKPIVIELAYQVVEKWLPEDKIKYQ